MNVDEIIARIASGIEPESTPLDPSSVVSCRAPTAKELAGALVAHEGAEPDTAETLAAMLLDNLRYSPAGVTVLDRFGRPALREDGTPMSAADLIAAQRAAIPQFFRPATKPEPVAKKATAASDPKGSKTPAQIIHEQRIADAMDKALKMTSGNPWKARNITAQILVQSRDPGLATKLKREAGLG